MKTIVAFLVASLACVPLGVSVEEDTDQPDHLSQMLFDTYLVHGRMVNTSTVMAASHIVAERGRNTGYEGQTGVESLVDTVRQEVSSQRPCESS